MRKLDQRAIERFGIPALILMEHAGRALAEAVQTFPGRRAAVFCGRGNNGGDGLVAARHLRNAGWRVRVILTNPPSALSPEAQINWRPLLAMGVPWRVAANVVQQPKKLIEFTLKSDVLVDALLGTGARGLLRPPVGPLIDLINGLGRPVVSADIPSGLDPDTGRVPDRAVRARATVAMGLPKPGLVQQAARPWVGRLWVADIGLPRLLIQPFCKQKPS
jgi:hydroxyethylthiazole kinase-like uncharacterized protein yjeF